MVACCWSTCRVCGGSAVAVCLCFDEMFVTGRHCLSWGFCASLNSGFCASLPLCARVLYSILSAFKSFKCCRRTSTPKECICDKGWRKSIAGCEWDCDTVDTLGCTGPGQTLLKDFKRFKTHFIRHTVTYYLVDQKRWTWAVNKQPWRSKCVWDLPEWYLRWWTVPLLGWLSWCRMLDVQQLIASTRWRCIRDQCGNDTFYLCGCNENCASLDKHLGCRHAAGAVFLPGRQRYVDKQPVWVGQRFANKWDFWWLHSVLAAGDGQQNKSLGSIRRRLLVCEPRACLPLMSVMCF